MQAPQHMIQQVGPTYQPEQKLIFGQTTVGGDMGSKELLESRDDRRYRQDGREGLA